MLTAGPIKRVFLLTLFVIGVELFMHFTQLWPGNVCVDLCGGNALVAEHFLNITEARTVT